MKSKEELKKIRLIAKELFRIRRSLIRLSCELSKVATKSHCNRISTICLKLFETYDSLQDKYNFILDQKGNIKRDR